MRNHCAIFLAVLLWVSVAWGQFATIHVRRVVQDSACGDAGCSTVFTLNTEDHFSPQKTYVLSCSQWDTGVAATHGEKCFSPKAGKNYPVIIDLPNKKIYFDPPECSHAANFDCIFGRGGYNITGEQK